jgi:hypothetical protein
MAKPVVEPQEASSFCCYNAMPGDWATMTCIIFVEPKAELLRNAVPAAAPKYQVPTLMFNIECFFFSWH